MAVRCSANFSLVTNQSSASLDFETNKRTDKRNQNQTHKHVAYPGFLNDIFNFLNWQVLVRFAIAYLHCFLPKKTACIDTSVRAMRSAMTHSVNVSFRFRRSSCRSSSLASSSWIRCQDVTSMARWLFIPQELYCRSHDEILVENRRN